MTTIGDVVLLEATIVDVRSESSVTYEISDGQGHTVALFVGPGPRDVEESTSTTVSPGSPFGI